MTPDDRHPSRRALLAAAGTLGTAGLAGCLGIGGDAGVELVAVQVQTGFDAEHTVHVELDRDGETVLDRTVTVGGSSPAVQTLDGWPREAADYAYRVASSGPAVDLGLGHGTVDPEDVPDGADCAVLTVALVDLGDVQHHVGVRDAAQVDVGCP